MSIFRRFNSIFIIKLIAYSTRRKKVNQVLKIVPPLLDGLLWFFCFVLFFDFEWPYFFLSLIFSVFRYGVCIGKLRQDDHKFKVSLNYKETVSQHTRTRGGRKEEYTSMNYLPNVDKLMILHVRWSKCKRRNRNWIIEHHLHLAFIVFTTERMPPQLRSKYTVSDS